VSPGAMRPGARAAAPGTSTSHGDPAPSGSGLDRLVFFSDAVFAIVITLLVLPLAAEFEVPSGSRSLADEVWSQWPRMLSFAVSFLVIGQFWIAHHSMFERIRRYDHGLLWLNLVFLLTISFQPFPTAVLGARLESDDQFPVVFYAASMTLSSATLTLSWLYARRRDLTDPNVPDADLSAFTARALATSAVFAASILVAFTGLVPAVLCWLVLLPVVRRVVVRRRPRRGPATRPRSSSEESSGRPG
jgi:uncharacterized membrane protein